VLPQSDETKPKSALPLSALQPRKQRRMLSAPLRRRRPKLPLRN
jgi:hypothetical protein